MQNNQPPFIPSDQLLPEITPKVVILAILLTLVLATSNAYLALKVGILASASIPAAIISMGVLRCFRKANILENNLVQTAASAGEAVAGGIVYTMPALVLIHYWQHFSYWENFFIALAGGLLGVLFSIPLRRILMTQPGLHFPEGRAIAEVLIAGTKKQFGFREIIQGGIIGAGLELFQTGFRIVASGIQSWFLVGKTVFGFSLGFSAPMIGVGYLIGFNVAASLFIGAILSWIIGVPIFSLCYPDYIQGASATDMALNLWSEKIRYVGIGAMLVAGLWTLMTLFKPFIVSIVDSFSSFGKPRQNLLNKIPRTERDVPIYYVIGGIVLLLFSFYVFFMNNFPLMALPLADSFKISILIICVIYLLIIGLFSSAICGYFSGLVGVTASPGSAIIIASLLIAALMLQMLGVVGDSDATKLAAAAATIFLGAIITSTAAIANDNIQDLKVGHIIGATPWKQQMMLMLGVVVAATVIPLVMELLFNVYGIGDVLPRAGMNEAEALPAPPAAMMAAVTQAIFNYALPWNMMIIGALIALLGVFINYFWLPPLRKISVLALAIGLYLPLTTSCSLFIGGALAGLCRRTLSKRVRRKELPESGLPQHAQRGIFIACGLVSGAAVMSVVLAIPFLLLRSPEALRLMPVEATTIAQGLGIVATVTLGYWIYAVVVKKNRE